MPEKPIDRENNNSWTIGNKKAAKKNFAAFLFCLIVFYVNTRDSEASNWGFSKSHPQELAEWLCWDL